MMNHAVYQTRVATANRKHDITLDAAGNATNRDAHGNEWHYMAVRAAQERQEYQVYQAAMTFLDGIFGIENSTQTVNRFNLATGKIEDRAHAERLQEKLILAALNGSNAALIAYASVSLYLNPYAPVDFGWFVNGSDELTAPITQEDGYPIQTGSATITVSATVTADLADFEGFAVTYRVATPTIPTTAPTAPAPVTIQDAEGRVLTQVATGWQTESKSSPGTFHTTAHDGSTCDCKGFTGRYKKCWHTQAVRRHLADQARHERETALPAPRPRIKTRSGRRSRMWK